jgi:hypothetical protein
MLYFPCTKGIADLLTIVETELGIPRRHAARTLRLARERLEIDTALDDKLDSLAYRREGLTPWVQLSRSDIPGTVAVSHAGWAHVDWNTGTLANYVVRVCWEQVVQTLAPISPKESKEGGEQEVRSIRSTGGKPPKHDWDAFWIEVALYASKNDLIGVERTELQQHMERWSAEHMSDPTPNPATVRAKIKKLYDAVPHPRK